MRVESFTSTNGLTRYILVDSSGVPVDVVLRFLRFKDNCGRARNTLRAYCFHLKSYFEYLEFIGMSFPQIGMDELAGFIRWLQNNHRQKKIMSFPAATVSTVFPLSHKSSVTSPPSLNTGKFRPIRFSGYSDSSFL